MANVPVFELSDVGFTYGSGEHIFSGISFKVLPGEGVCLLGANGSGKTTLLKIMCGLAFPSAGSMFAFGKRIDDRYFANDRHLKEYHRRIGFVFQNSDAQLFTTRVWDEIAFGPLQMGMPRDEVRRRTEDIISMLGIGHLVDRPPFRLSGGEKKKVAVASVLVLNPEVLILDEPTGGLDPKSQRWMADLLLALREQGKTVILATHNLDLAHRITDRALVLDEEHRLVYDGPAAEALDNRELLSSVNLIEEYTHDHGQGIHRHRLMHE